MRAPSCILEPLEARIAPATFTVTTTADSGLGSLRQAILDANANGVAEADLISFAIDGAGVHTINVLSALPALTQSITIDGSTQAGYAASPLIFLDGTNAGADVSGLILGGGDTVKALGITHFSSHGIFLLLSSYTPTSGVSGYTPSTVVSCYIGVDATGSGAAGNGGSGIFASNNPNLYVQSPHYLGAVNRFAPLPGEGNLISANGRYGIEVPSGFVVNNYVGVTADGNTALGNGLGGIRITGGGIVNNNLVSGNGGSGIDYTLPPTADYMTPTGIWNNIVGLNASGTAAIPNHGIGIIAANLNPEDAPRPTSGSILPGLTDLSIFENTVSGNDSHGIVITGGVYTSVGNNTIGLGLDKTTVFANGGHGIKLVTGSVIGINSNLISGNTGNGIELLAGSQIEVKGNKIGVDATGALAKGNGGAGINSLVNDTNPTIYRYRSAPIPTLLEVTGNLIAHNGGAGIQMGGDVGVFAPNSFGNNGGSALAGVGMANPPVISSAVPVTIDSAGNLGTTVSGIYEGSVNQQATIYLYSIDATGAPSAYLGTTTIQTDANGHANFTTTVNAFVSGRPVVATAVESLPHTEPGWPTPAPQTTYYRGHTSVFSNTAIVASQITISNATVTEGIMARASSPLRYRSPTPIRIPFR